MPAWRNDSTFSSRPPFVVSSPVCPRLPSRRPSPSALARVLASITLFMCRAAAEPSPALPNIVLIVPDDLGRNDVSFNGGGIATPNIDLIAKEGVRLSRFYAAPVCSPTRAGLMTALSHSLRADAVCGGAVAALRAGYRGSDAADSAGGGRLCTPGHLRQVALGPLRAQVAPAAARLHGVRRLAAVGEPQVRAAGRLAAVRGVGQDDGAAEL